MGTLYYGDNLEILRRHLKDESVDLVYLDPPFKSDQNYNVLFQENNGSAAASQIQAFEDTWHWNMDSERAYAELVTQPGKVSEVMQAFRTFLGQNDMMAYLAMMAPRLLELHRVLKPTGSLYLHCDPTASHYLKLLLDAIFRQENFRNEILWYYYNKIHDRRKKLFPKATDTLLFYVKDVRSEFVFHQLKEKRETPVKQLLRKKVAGVMVNVKDENGHVMYRVKEDRTLDNVWRIPCLQPAAPERLGYPTQKPVALLERVILASSDPGGLVLDPFCGCGTTIDAAEKHGRDWIGIDITQLAITLIKKRLFDSYGYRVKFINASAPEAEQAVHDADTIAVRVVGEPATPADAAKLAEEDKFQFQWWALGLVGARPEEEKKGADRGIDGKILFRDDPKAAKPEQIIIQVKGGKTGVKDVRDLRGVLDREKAAIGILISLQPPTGPMETEAASAGFYTSKGGASGFEGRKYPRIQLRTVKELMEGKGIERPSSAASFDDTFKKAPESKKKHGEQKQLI